MSKQIPTKGSSAKRALPSWWHSFHKVRYYRTERYRQKVRKKHLVCLAGIGSSWAGAAAGAKIGALLGAATGLAAPVAVPLLSFAGGIAGSALAQLAVDISAVGD